MAVNPREKISKATLSDVDLLTRDIAGQFGADISPEETQDESALDKDLYDRQYDDSNKRHRNLLSKLNHWFVIVSHPFSLVIIFMVVFIRGGSNTPPLGAVQFLRQ